jgi:hypothetical protein
VVSTDTSVFYRLSGNAVEIIRVLHSARDVAAILSEADGGMEPGVRKEIDVGLAQAQCGEAFVGEEVFAELERQLTSRSEEPE